MHTYKVFFWLGSHTINPFIKPTIIEVESNVELTEREVTNMALESFEIYPKIYSVRVEKEEKENTI